MYTFDITIARQSPSSSRRAAVGWSKPRRRGARKGGRHVRLDIHNAIVRSAGLRRACAIDMLHHAVKAGLAAPGEVELPRERLSHLRNAAYDVADLAARVISPFRHALKSVMFLKRVRRRRAAIAFCPRLPQPSFLSS